MTGEGITAESLSDQPIGQIGRVLVTGASGFIGSALVRDLAGRFGVRAASRRPLDRPDAVVVGDLGRDTDWSAALDGVDAVVHLAGPAHAGFAPEALECAIVDGTRTLVEQAAEAGVRRVVYVSSIHACAHRTTGAPLDEDTPPHPDNAYGRAKLAAESIVLGAGAGGVVLRPPLVFGVAAKGNFAKLLRLLDSDVPAPLGGISNKRNVIALESLETAIVAVLQKPDVSGVFHVADDPAVSTSDMAALLREGMGRTAGLFQLPGLAAMGPRALTDSLEVNSTRFKHAFGATGVDTREALIACGREWAARR